MDKGRWGGEWLIGDLQLNFEESEVVILESDKFQRVVLKPKVWIVIVKPRTRHVFPSLTPRKGHLPVNLTAK